MAIGVIKNYTSFVGEWAGDGWQNKSKDDLVHWLENVNDYLKFAPEWWKNIFLNLDPKQQLQLSKSITFLEDRTSVKCKYKPVWGEEGVAEISFEKNLYVAEKDTKDKDIVHQDGIDFVGNWFIKKNIPDTLQVKWSIINSLAKIMPAQDYVFWKENIAIKQVYELLGIPYKWYYEKTEWWMKYYWWGEHDASTKNGTNYPAVDVSTWYLMTSSINNKTSDPFVLSTTTEGDWWSYSTMSKNTLAPTIMLKEPIKYLE